MSAAPRLSVILATFNRRASAERLLRQLASQTLAVDQYEIVIVDDGSAQPLSEWLPDVRMPCRVTAVRQANGGAAAARHRGVLQARGDVLVVTDDDMQVPRDFLATHLSYHETGSRRAIIGRIRPSSKLPEMPLFERFHADLLDRWKARRRGGEALCTGNLSLRRSDYLAVGGFDTSLERAEDIDLGIRLEQSGVEVVFSEEAFSVHDSDHTDFAAWRRHALIYGRCWTRISRKYPRLVQADPWCAFFGNALAKRPFITAGLVLPRLGGALAGAVQRAALAVDRLGLERLALRLTSLLWDLEFFRGVRQEAGSLGATVSSCVDFVEKAAAGAPTKGVGPVTVRLGRAMRRLCRRDPRPA
jgi:GT2 family glycosyltransferase